MTTRGLGHAIDFGTSTSQIVVCRPDGGLVPIAERPVLESLSIPTAIWVRDDGSILVGRMAAQPAR